ncbi:2OG-Fe(II) oxygenase [Paraburkholderia sp. BL17N1]|uniref:2OG-Fe(II) oxygenase n=1 Tax=Paraburkholderia sp. BL17N1 TaxID=1938798 RepID=UPI000EACE3C8|nr:2OG-Fe(II) oxygenase [Paraburkholderia sp. BL17N1]RKR43226.1 2-oxoglutarate-Fe(II)-dependent oxygenase superfamily protein [Paraburkholderia sp. BL17N1]
MQAPILLVPKAINSSLCTELILAWEWGGHELSYMMVEESNKRLGRVYDPRKKSRQDHFLSDVNLLKKITADIRQNVLPHIELAFRYKVTRYEDFRIGCYESDQMGFFGPHRDDSTEGTAHRAFALSVGLNEEPYDGGEIKFPNFAYCGYKLQHGDALVFSSGLIHEVTPVTSGRRFALLSFLYGESESKRRKEYYCRLASATLPT